MKKIIYIIPIIFFLTFALPTFALVSGNVYQNSAVVYNCSSNSNTVQVYDLSLPENGLTGSDTCFPATESETWGNYTYVYPWQFTVIETNWPTANDNPDCGNDITICRNSTTYVQETTITVLGGTLPVGGGFFGANNVQDVISGGGGMLANMSNFLYNTLGKVLAIFGGLLGLGIGIYFLIKYITGKTGMNGCVGSGLGGGGNWWNHGKWEGNDSLAGTGLGEDDISRERKRKKAGYYEEGGYDTKKYKSAQDALEGETKRYKDEGIL